MEDAISNSNNVPGVGTVSGNNGQSGAPTGGMSSLPIDVDSNAVGSQAMFNQKQVQYTIPGILHFIQNEWTKFEMERSQWEIDKAEFQAKIAFLQGERRGQENLKSDLIRRIKMLEYTLKQERDKFYKLKHGIDLKQGDMRSPFDDQITTTTTIVTSSVTSVPSSNIIDTTNLNANANVNSVIEDNSEYDGTVIMDSLKSLQPQLQPQIKANNGLSDDNVNDLNSMNSAWRQGRQILRQYLQEIGCTDTVLDLRSNKLKNLLSGKNMVKNRCPAIDEKWHMTKFYDEEHHHHKTSLENNLVQFYPFLTNSNLLLKDVNDETDDLAIDSADSFSNFKDDDDIDVQARQVCDELNLLSVSEKIDFKDYYINKNEPDREGKITQSAVAVMKAATAVFQNEQNNEMNLGELAGLTVSNDADTYQDVTKTWNAKYTLRNHFDCVRTLAFDLKQPILVTGSDDCTLKLWNLQKNLSAKKVTSFDSIEPIYTFRSHTSPVLCLALDNDLYDSHESFDRKLFSADLHGNLLCWNLPNFNIDAYDSYQSNILDSKLIGHTDAIHSLVYYQMLLLSCSADKSVKLWSPNTSKLSNNKDSLKMSFFHANDYLTPTSADFLRLESYLIATGYDNGSISFQDFETGKTVLNVDSATDKCTVGTRESLIYRLVSHPTMSLIMTAHEDRNIRYWDYKSGKLVHSMVAHLDAVTCLSVDPKGQFLLSGSHDCSIRLWNLSSKTCVQEITVHRKKFDESILDVAFHPSRQFIASAGADNIAKVFVSV